MMHAVITAQNDMGQLCVAAVSGKWGANEG